MSDLRASLGGVECGRDTGDAGDATLKAQHEYENVGLSTTHAADSLVAGLSRRKLTKKPKPGPKPNFVAVRVAELNLKQKINSNETSCHVSPTKPAQHGCLAAHTPERTAVEKSSTCRRANSERATSDLVLKLTEQLNVSWSDDDVYDTAVPVDRDVATLDDQKHSRSWTTARTGVTDSRPSDEEERTPSDEEEPIYDDAIAVVSHEEPLYEEAAVVQASRLQTLMCEEQEPVYAEPAEILADAAAAGQYSDEDSFLYEEALPVDKLAVARGATATNC